MHLSLFPVLACVLLVAARATAAPDAEAILKRMNAALEPERPSIRMLVVTVESEGGTVEWTACRARKRLPNENRMLTVILAPNNVRGVALLERKPRGAPSEHWYYVPALRRVRKASSVSAYESLLASDFTLGDSGLVDVQNRQVRLLGEEKVGATSAYKLEEVFAEDGGFASRLVTWVAKNSKLPLRREYYDRANQLWKTELFEDITVIDGIPTMLQFRMQDNQENTSTTLRVSGVQYDVPVPDDLFDSRRLPDVGKRPLWSSTVP